MKCQSARDCIVLLNYGELPDELAGVLEQHLAGCEDCREELETFRGFEERLATAAGGGAFAEPAGAVADAAGRCAGHDSAAWISYTTEDEFLPVDWKYPERAGVGDAAAGRRISDGKLYAPIPSRECAEAEGGDVLH